MGFSFSSKPSQGKKALFKIVGPPEDVAIKVHRNQIVALSLPHETSRAFEIRTAVRTKVLTSAKKEIFMFFTEDNSWTNRDRKSTAVEPLLTAPPAEALDKAHNVLTNCAAVASVTILDENDHKITLA